MPSQPLSAAFAVDAFTGVALPRAIATITPDSDPAAIAAVREWQAHLDAGRIGSFVPSSPDRLASEAQVREMERIFGVRRGGIW